MGIAEIEKRILGEAEAEADKIKIKAEEEAAEIEAAGRIKAEEIRRQILAEAKRKAEEEKRAILVPARLASKKKLLEEKHKILNEVFAGISPEVREKKEMEAAKLLYG